MVANESDFSEPDQNLKFERTYTSGIGLFDLTNLGPQWRSNFDRRITMVSSGSSTVATSYRSDGDRYHFVLTSGQWISDPDITLVLTSSQDSSGNITGWTLTDIDGTQEIYNAQGYLTKIIPLNQHTLTLSYSGIYLTTVTDERNRSLTFKYGQIAYQSQTRLVEVDTPDGLSIQYGYSSSTGMLTSVSYVGSVNGQSVTQTRTYVYGENGAPNYAMTGLIDEAAQRYTSWSYDAQGRANLSVHGAISDYPGRTQLIYNSDGSTSITNWTDGTANLSLTRLFGFDVVQGVAHLSGVSCASCSSAAIQLPGIPTQPASVTFDSSGYPQSTMDFNHNLTTTQYDDTYGLLLQKVEASGASSQRTTKLTWDTTFRKPLNQQILDAQGNLVAETSWVYNYLGEVHVRCEIDPAVPAAAAYTCADTGAPPAGVRRWIYHYCGSVDTIQCPVVGLLLTVDGPRTDVADTTSYVYYMLDGVNHHHGDLKSVTDPLGHVTTYLIYDGAGRVTSMQDANGVYTDFTYTPRGWLQTKTVRVTPDNSPSSSDAITTLGYTAYGAVNSITDPDGVVTTFQYDTAHRLTDIYDALGKHIHYTLDAAGNKTAEQTFTAAGTVVRSLSRTFNALGELTAVEDGLNHTVFSAGYSDSYDANGNLVHSVDGLGYQRYQGFDALNRLTSTIANYNGTDPATQNSTTTVKLDALDRQTQVTDPTGLHTTYGYDGLGDRTQLQSPDTGTSTDTYDAAGNRLTHTDAKGVVSSSTYDADNRLTGTSYADSSLNVSYDYDESNAVTGCASSRPIGRLTRVVESGVTTIYCYGGHGNISQKKQVTSSHTDVTVYGYTLADRLSSVLAPDGTQVNYSYNSNGLLSGVQVTPSGSGTASTVVSNINWLPFGPMVDYTLGNGQTVTRSYDANYAPTDLTSPALSLHFARDVMGDIQALGNAPGANPATETYGYDPLYRLTGVTEASGTALENYTYNQTGDRLSKTATDQVTGGGTYTYTPGTHQLASIGNAARSSDANGNTLTSVMGGNSYGFGYNGRNRLTTAQLNGQTVGTYTYNALGERIGKVASFPQSITERYAYNEAGQLIGEYGTTNRDYVWLGDLPVAVIDNTINGGVTTSTVNYITADQLGTPRAVSNSAGTVIWSWTYQGNPFGEQLPTSTTGYVLNLRYPGQYFDAESETSYNYYRTYEPATGRYLQSDPIGLKGGISTYAYVRDQPLALSDNLGLAAGQYVFLPGGVYTTSQGPGSGQGSTYCQNGILVPYVPPSPDPLNEKCGILECERAHEESHIRDELSLNQAPCQNQANGTFVGFTYGSDLWISEQKAIAEEIRCLLEKLHALQPCDECRRKLEERLQDERDYGERNAGPPPPR